MDVTLGLNSVEIEKILEEAGLVDGVMPSNELLRKAISKAISENNDSIVKQLLDMVGKMKIDALMQQFMK